MAVLTASKITVKEFFEMDLEEGYDYDLINGIILRTQSSVNKKPPKPIHQNASMNLSRILSIHVFENKIGKLFASPIDVYFDNYNNTQPDILFIKKERLFIITERGIEGAPDLIVEILSPSTFKRDKKEKFDLYMRFGVSEYWIVDPYYKSIEVFELENNNYKLAFEASESGMIQSKVLEGFSLEISTVFE